MRNLFLILLLANLLLFAWQQWIVAPEVQVVAPALEPGLELAAENGQVPVPAAGAGGRCLRVGPFENEAMARRVARVLADRQIDSKLFGRDGQVWLGHWVQVAGFATAESAELARQRLVAGGLPDAYLVQEGSLQVISLGVFREKSRADAVADTARQLGFSAVTRDRYRPAVEQWLLVEPSPEQRQTLARLRLPDARILRTEPARCGQPAGP